MGISSIAELIPDPKNARKRGPRAEGILVASLHEVGAARSIVIDENNLILAGNGTVQAASEAGIEKLHIVDVDGETLVAVRRSGLTDAQKKRLAILDNRTSELAEWDTAILAELAQEGIPLDDLWSADELEALLADVMGGPAELLTDPDAIPDDVETRCKLGDLWKLGEHRLLCGDSTKAEDVARLMGGAKAALCLTDPPYGVGLAYESTDDTEVNLKRLVDGFLPLAREVSAYVLLTPGNKNQWIYPRPDWCMAWFVPAGAGRGPHGFTCWQPVLAYGKEPYLARAKGSRPDALCKTETAPQFDHPCPKPVEVWKWWMERGSVDKGDLIYDPFLGTGTSIIAAIETERKCYGLEIDPHYCDVILQRYENATGNKAERLIKADPQYQAAGDARPTG